MLALLEQRGPDDQGEVSVNGDLWLVGNGEVYNHEAVGRSLREEGVEFRTRSDNEVALHLVDRHGPDALGELNGMFAFVLAGSDGRFVAARDPVGIKPLYWARGEERIVFASEMAAFDPADRERIEVF